VEAPAQQPWIEEWALYAALKARFGARPWSQWPREIVARDPGALEGARRDLAGEIEFEKYLQFLFFHQWDRVKQDANRRGILIMGDLPIYVALDGADVWASRHLFTVGADGTPERVAGVPPDYFSSTGQRWGNPLYRWDRMEETSYEWWVERLRTNLRTADLVRIDHFRGFAAFWSILASEPTAIAGEWAPGPGIKLFDALRAALGELPIVAEDLGVITPDVDELRAAIGCPGMRVLQFAFSETDSPHLPHRYPPNSVVYTGTHDNDTSRGWFEKAGGEERQRALDYLGGHGREIEWDLIRAAFTSVANTTIVPVQDVLGLGSEARMNTPGRVEGNWRWRLGPDDLDPARATRVRRLAELTGRLGSRR
jgi:4-alpha-glucanotransferase